MYKIKYDSVFGKRLLTVLFASILLSSFGVLSDGMFASAVSYTIDKTKSGLVASDPLNNQTETKNQVLSDTRYWNYYGTAVAEKNTPYDIYKDAQGLHIGEPGPDPTQFGDGSYSGYYAVSPHTNAILVHAVLTATNQPVLHNDFQNQLEIMTTSGIVNYLDCAAITNTDGTYWTLVHGYGDTVEASHFDTLWVDTSPNQPLTRDCTVITNGSNYLKLYMDNVLVYSSNTLALNMPAPFDYYLQTMNSYYNQMRYGVFKDYYATTDENIKITNNPSNAVTVALVDSSGKSLASSSVTAGTATLDVGKYHFPVSGTINVYDGNNNVIASSTESIYGGDAFSVNVSSGTQTVPQPPTNLSAATASSSQINLSWNAPSDNGGSAITGYQIESSTDSGSTWSTIVSNTGSTSTTYSNTGLSPSTAYTYRVSAINDIGTSSPSNISSATTSAAPTVPQPPTGLSADAISSSQVNLSWSAPSDNGGSAITGYMVERSQDNGNTWSTVASNTASASTTYSDSGLGASTTYSYRVSAINSVGTSSPSNIASVTTSHAPTSPQPPTSLSASTISSSKINLSWTEPSDNGGSAITGYMIERSTDAGSTWSTIVSNTGSTGTTYSNTGLSPSTTYTYRVSAINGVGTSSPSNVSSATTSTQVLPPQPPTNLLATAISSSQINLSWSAPGNDGGSSIVGYKIERSTNSGAWSTIVSNTGSTSTTYTDNGLLPLMTYSYRVSAINGVGTSMPSNVASATTQLIGPVPIPGGLISPIGISVPKL